ncbi:uncharacterized protein LOC111627383 [Centruroides sculpturatus]|uniref:uncharacterized protein LOC111627383 n=1 Tax=Centruroides sculpturatus TaxID=218467 RepID=UPI000C6D887C|nr:uncharacterized protein LOC111627383 [Centruroides sculpturatus]
MSGNLQMISLTIIYLVLCQSFALGQFFTKTTNSIPRMGRRSEISNMQQNRLNRSLRYLMSMVEGYDSDRNGHLSAEELLNIPFVQMAVENLLSAKNEKKKGNFFALSNNFT